MQVNLQPQIQQRFSPQMMYALKLLQLTTVELDQEIPPEHFTAVAEIIGYIMRQRGDLPLH